MAAIAPSGGGRGNGHIPPDDKGRDKKRKADGHDPTVDASHHADKKDKKAPKLPTLSDAHQEYVRGFINELHGVATATAWLQLPQVVRLTQFFSSKQEELVGLKGKVSTMAAFRFLHHNEDVKGKAVAVFKSLDFMSWPALQLVVASNHDESVEETIRSDLRMLREHDPIARRWDEERIMACVRTKDPRGLVKHMFPEADLS